MISFFLTAIADFDLYNEARFLSPITRRWYTYQLELFAEFLIKNKIDPLAIAGRDILKFMALERRRELSDQTIAARYRALRSFFKWVEEHGYLGGLANPVKKSYKPKTEKKEPKRVMDEQYQALQASITGDDWIDARDRLLLAVLFRCGVRVGECAGLRMSSIDFKRKRFKVSSKSSKTRRDRLVPFDDQVQRLLLTYLDERPECEPDYPDALWFSDDGVGGVRGVMTKFAVTPMLRRRCAAAGLPTINPHAFRHGFAMEMLNNGGAEMSSVSALLGHASVETTEDAYAEWLIDSLQREYDEAQAKISGRQGKISDNR